MKKQKEIGSDGQWVKASCITKLPTKSGLSLPLLLRLPRRLGNSGESAGPGSGGEGARMLCKVDSAHGGGEDRACDRSVPCAC